MRTSIIKIGNSHYILIPQKLLEKSGLSGEVDIVVEKGTLVIRSINTKSIDT